MTHLSSKLKQPWRVRRAARLGSTSAALLTAFHLISAFFSWTRPSASILSDDPQVLLTAQFAGAAVASCLALRLRKPAPVWLLAFLLAWTLACLLPGGPATYLYGYRMWAMPGLLCAYAAFMGLRAALVVQRDGPTALQGY